MIRLLFAVLVLFAVVMIMRHIRRQKPAQRRLMWLQLVITGSIGLLVIAVLTGKLHWIGALPALIVPFLTRLLPLITRLLPLFQLWKRHRQRTNTSQGNQSSVNTATLRMTLDHDSGDLDGEVLAGPLAGQALNQLSKDQLRSLIDYCQEHDQEAIQLLATYIQRRFNIDPNTEAFQQEWFSPGKDQAPLHSADMSPQEARQVLGVSDQATREEIIAAHKKLMQKLHPDRGGSDFLAAKVNQAKDTLLR